MSTAANFDHVIASSGRLRILTALAAETRINFVGLRKLTHLTDGNLATHTRRLEMAGFVTVEKSFQDRKPVTHMRLTAAGRDALERHAKELLAALTGMGGGRQSALVTEAPAEPPGSPYIDDWVD